jgi:hypothetical protein
MLRCEFGRVAVVKRKEDIVPELYRESNSKRQNCKYGVTINYPLTPQNPHHVDRPVFTSVHPWHNHDIWPDASRMMTEKPSVREIRLLEELAKNCRTAGIDFFMAVCRWKRLR